jgi:ABC-2 type transport system permease protein
MALSLTIVFLANVFKNSTAVFFISILMFIVFKGLSIAFSRYSSFFITSMFEWYDVWTIFPFQYMTVLRQLLLIFGYGIMFYTAGFYLFDKKDL